MIKIFYSKIKKLFHIINFYLKKITPKFPLKVISIDLDKNDDYIAIIQVVNKNEKFFIRPEELLINDALLDLFSPKDIRALTYLGYHEASKPSYKILSQKLSKVDQKYYFAIKKKGNKKTIIKSAMQISSNNDLINGLHQKDAHMVGFAMATEQIREEKQEMQKLLTQTQN